MKMTIAKLGIEDQEVSRKIKFLKQSYIIKKQIDDLGKIENAFFDRFNSEDEKNHPTPDEIMDFSEKDSQMQLDVIEALAKFIAGVFDKKVTKAYENKVSEMELTELLVAFQETSAAIQIGDVELDADSVAQAQSGKA